LIDSEGHELRYPGRAEIARAEPDRPATSLLRPVIKWASPAGGKGRLTVLIFHRVLEQPDPIFPNEMHADAFRQRMEWVRAWFNVVPLSDAVGCLYRGSLPERALAITFDDGYGNNQTTALPILRQLGLHATFFVATGFLDGGCMWNDRLIEAIRGAGGRVLEFSSLGLGTYDVDTPDARRHAIMSILYQIRYLPAEEREAQVDAIAAATGAQVRGDVMLTTAQLRDLASTGMGIGGHTVTHPILARLDDAKARREMADGRDALESIVRQPIKLFAYPNGKPSTDYTAAHVRIAKELGFVAALSTAPGAARVGDDPHQLPRFTPWDRTPATWGWRLLRNFRTASARCA
jgi:peptidoglycan/xylan/chitin deacetylase (PgdA/CDA1 family)